MKMTVKDLQAVLFLKYTEVVDTAPMEDPDMKSPIGFILGAICIITNKIGESICSHNNLTYSQGNEDKLLTMPDLEVIHLVQNTITEVLAYDMFSIFKYTGAQEFIEFYHKELTSSLLLIGNVIR